MLHYKKNQKNQFLLWFRQWLWLFAGSTNRVFLRLLGYHKMELRLHFPLMKTEKGGLRLFICWYDSVSVRTVRSPDLMKGHQPLVLFCWKIEIFSVPPVNISALHDFAVLAPRGKLWRSNSTVPTCIILISQTLHTNTNWLTCERHIPRKSSDDSVSKSQTWRLRIAGSFCSVLSREKIFSLLLTTITWDVGRIV